MILAISHLADIVPLATLLRMGKNNLFFYFIGKAPAIMISVKNVSSCGERLLYSYAGEHGEEFGGSAKTAPLSLSVSCEITDSSDISVIPKKLISRAAPDLMV